MSSSSGSAHAVTYACPNCSKALRSRSAVGAHLRWCRGGAAVDAEAGNALRAVQVAARSHAQLDFGNLVERARAKLTILWITMRIRLVMSHPAIQTVVMAFHEVYGEMHKGFFAEAIMAVDHAEQANITELSEMYQEPNPNTDLTLRTTTCTRHSPCSEHSSILHANTDTTTTADTPTTIVVPIPTVELYTIN